MDSIKVKLDKLIAKLNINFETDWNIMQYLVGNKRKSKLKEQC